jgi:hypothetical protein
LYSSFDSDEVEGAESHPKICSSSAENFAMQRFLPDDFSLSVAYQQK